MSAKHDELDSLLFDSESGALDEQGVERLRQMLKHDPAARSHFLEMQMLSAAMHLEADAGLTPPPNDDASPAAAAVVRKTESARGVLGAPLWLTSALALLVCILAGWIVYSQVSRAPGGAGRLAETPGDPSTRDASQEATSHGVALITRLVDVEWGLNQPELEVGDSLSPGRFAIQAGHAQVEFLCGATVVVEGPAELELESATRARVRNGRLRAHVPPAARGFSLEVDDLTVVDLGTEFGLSVSPEGANVQVFDGEVELHRSSNESLTDKRLLTAGQAVVRTAEGAYREAQATPESFVDIAGLESRAEIQRSARYERWKAWSDDVRRDPRLIAYYAFDQAEDWERRLACSNTPTNRELDGAIVGAREIEGRWGTKRALEFKQPADRVRVQIPGEYRSLTLACWVKIDSLDRWYNSLFLTDGYDQGEPHWQILDTGQLFFSVRVRSDHEDGPPHRKVLSPPFWQPSMSGKWLHLATTYDVGLRRTTHYLNGEVLHSEMIPEAQLVTTTRIGAASIGNWAAPTKPDAEFAIRNLNGSIDEFTIFAAALTAEEIKEMVEHGKP